MRHSESIQHFIGGRWVHPVEPKFANVVNPATEDTVGRVAIGSSRDVELAVRAATKAFETYRWFTIEQRASLLGRIIAGFKDRLEDLAATITREIGTATTFAHGHQTQMALAHFEEAQRILYSYRFEYQSGENVIRREPFGVCGLITAWNWPAMLITSKLASALAAGCTVVLKPSELAPGCGTIIAEILEAAGTPPGVFNLVHGDGPGVGAAISSHPGIALISFTGSKRAGVAITKAAADTVKSVHLELGGKSANIILRDADLKVAIEDAVRRSFINTGQSCIAPTRLLVPRDQIDNVLTVAQRTAEAMPVGSPLSSTTNLGPSANAPQLKRVQDLIHAGINEGATVVCGGLGRPDGLNRGYFTRPTIFTDVKPNMRIAQEEIFGPVLSIITYTNEEEAIEIANGTSYGLAGYVSSANEAHALRVAAKLEAGRVFINGAMTNPSAPFGGYKESGVGREWGVFGLETFLEVKAILGQTTKIKEEQAGA